MFNLGALQLCTMKFLSLVGKANIGILVNLPKFMESFLALICPLILGNLLCQISEGGGDLLEVLNELMIVTYQT